MEKMMTKTNYKSNLATLDDHNTLADTELNAVTGGSIPGESCADNHRDWLEIVNTDPTPVGVWNDLLHNYGY
jgi:hypothetical protein